MDLSSLRINCKTIPADMKALWMSSEMKVIENELLGVAMQLELFF
jgi:hypothetical protein